MPEIRNFSIKKLTLLENNPRRITKEQMTKLCESMKADPDFLWNRPVLVNESEGKFIVYAGNQRVRAAKSMKMTEIPCIIDKDLSEGVIKERIVKDNAHFGEWDFDILANEYNIDTLLDCGFTADEIVGSVQDISTDEKGEEKEEKPKCELCGK